MTRIEQEASAALARHQTFDVVSMDVEGVKYWVKRARKTGARSIHRVAYAVLKHPLLVPSLVQSPQQALMHESSKLVRLEQKGVNVPSVVTVNETFFILEDQGSSVLNAIRNGEVTNVPGLLEKVVEVLSALHVKGEFHGGAQIKNFTCKEGKVFALDFEEAFDKAIPLEDLQFRDLFLFLFSLAKHRVEADYAKLIGLYEARTKKGMAKRVKALAGSFGALARLAHTPLAQKVLDQDSKSAFRLLGILGTLALKEEA
ncbi:hypothetical protein JWV37_07620 [Sulfurospirillum sp. T05]|uniref:tRNA A-37 threonylcarbamoyl transferase component Bud32 n=1 Tax=Sulfurospirillum tamanense TaxID=2813362 RepID=A0ABS2WTX8_9BACT|nr:hypothetical protein [Sulfurospirillum tamanensis]MBN2964644.1 hypothetical protein [Sulfurospirillum tamanensis]